MAGALARRKNMSRSWFGKPYLKHIERLLTNGTHPDGDRALLELRDDFLGEQTHRAEDQFRRDIAPHVRFHDDA